MTATIDDIRSVTENVFGSLTEFIVEPHAWGDDSRDGVRFVTAAVNITGAWEGTVAVECSQVLARLISGAFFGIDAADADDSEVRDAVGEIGNMIGGNVKALLPSPSQLSLPTVTMGIDYRVSFPGTLEASREAFLVEGQPFFVTVLRKAD